MLSFIPPSSYIISKFSLKFPKLSHVTSTSSYASMCVHALTTVIISLFVNLVAEGYFYNIVHHY